MNRIMFQSEFHQSILSGAKTGTIRLSKRPKKPGSYAAVNGRFQPATEKFATLNINEVVQLPWSDVTDKMLSRTNAPRSWYTDRYGDALQPDTLVTFYGFELSREASE